MRLGDFEMEIIGGTAPGECLVRLAHDQIYAATQADEAGMNS